FVGAVGCCGHADSQVLFVTEPILTSWNAEVRVSPLGLTNCYKFCPAWHGCGWAFIKGSRCGGYGDAGAPVTQPVHGINPHSTNMIKTAKIIAVSAFLACASGTFAQASGAGSELRNIVQLSATG